MRLFASTPRNPSSLLRDMSLDQLSKLTTQAYATNNDAVLTMVQIELPRRDVGKWLTAQAAKTA